MRTSRAIILLLTFLSLTKCASYEEPYVVGVNDVFVQEANMKKVVVKANLLIHNPNNVSLDLSRTVLIVTTQDKEVAKIDQSYDIEMPAKGDFDLPLLVDIDLGKLADGDIMKTLQMANQILGDRQIEIHITGHLYAGKDKVKLKIPVDRSQTVQF